MQSVTSNAVYNALSRKANGNGRIDYVYFTPQQINDVNTIVSVLSARPEGSLILFAVGWEDYQTYPYAGHSGFFMTGGTSAKAFGQMWTYSSRKVNYGCYFTDRIDNTHFAGWDSI